MQKQKFAGSNRLCRLYRNQRSIRTGRNQVQRFCSPENGTLADNSNCCYLFILPANTEIVPYDNGYYAEFVVNSFSEFWLNNGGAGGVSPLPVSLLSLEALKQTKTVLLKWVTENEINVDRYIIERSTDGTSYSAIAEVAAFNNNQNNYTYTDLQPIPGLNFYRLKIKDKDASYTYSPVRKVDFGSVADDITVYPNPVTEDRIYIASSGNLTNAILYDAAGSLIKTFRLAGRNATLDIRTVSGEHTS